MNYTVTVNGKVYDVEVERAPAAVPAAPKSAPAATGNSITSPMPGNIWEVRCKSGDTVSAGQVVFVLEAMKMEIEVPAPCAGTIDQVLVTKGDAVDNGSVLAALK